MVISNGRTVFLKDALWIFGFEGYQCPAPLQTTWAGNPRAQDLVKHLVLISEQQGWVFFLVWLELQIQILKKKIVFYLPCDSLFSTSN